MITHRQQTAHLVYGPTAAGNGVRFAIDEGMHTRFAPDRPERLDLAWARDRVARCRAQVWSVAQRVLQRNAAKGETCTFDVTPQMFEVMETWFERPNDEELARCSITRRTT